MDAAEVKTWRRAEREQLIAARMDVPPTTRRAWSEKIDTGLRNEIAPHPGILGVYWPFRAEFDPRPLIDWAVAQGRGVALPVVVDKKGPLEYRSWRPGEALVDGVWNIPVPEIVSFQPLAMIVDRPAPMMATFDLAIVIEAVRV